MNALASLLLLGSSTAPSLTGSWSVNGARLDVRQSGNTVVGALASAGGACAIPLGTEVLRGSLLEDSLAAQVRLTRTAPPAPPKLDAGSLLRADKNRLAVHLAAESQDLREAPGLAAARPAPGPRTEPAGPDARPLRGLSALQEGRHESARQLCREALPEQPAGAEARNGVGVSFYARGDLDEALAGYKRAIETDPRFGDACDNLACLDAPRGERPLALRDLRLAALNRDSEPDQMLTDPDLRSLQGAPQFTQLVEQLSVERKPSRPGASQP